MRLILLCLVVQVHEDVHAHPLPAGSPARERGRGSVLKVDAYGKTSCDAGGFPICSVFAPPGVCAARAAGHSSSMMSMIRITKRSCFISSPSSLSFDSSIHARREKSRRILPLTGKCAQKIPRCESPRIGGFLHISRFSPQAVPALVWTVSAHRTTPRTPYPPAAPAPDRAWPRHRAARTAARRAPPPSARG